MERTLFACGRGKKETERLRVKYIFEVYFRNGSRCIEFPWNWVIFADLCCGYLQNRTKACTWTEWWGGRRSGPGDRLLDKEPEAARGSRFQKRERFIFCFLSFCRLRARGPTKAQYDSVSDSVRGAIAYVGVLIHVHYVPVYIQHAA